MTEPARLILWAPQAADAALLAQRLDTVLRAVSLDAVILAVQGSDDRARINYAKTIAAATQQHGAALLLIDNVELVARTGADGVHLTSPARLAEALSILRPLERIVGVGGLKARHDAMEAAEAGVDYVMFGEPRADGSVPAPSAVRERAEWWAELFQTPCVAYAATFDDAVPLAETGAEFVAFGHDVFTVEAEGHERVVRFCDLVIKARRPDR